MVGYFLCGQVLAVPPDEARYRATAAEIGAEPDAYVAGLGDVRVVPLEQYEASVRSMHFLATLIGDQAAAAIDSLATLEQAREAERDAAARVDEMRNRARLLARAGSALETRAGARGARRRRAARPCLRRVRRPPARRARAGRRAVDRPPRKRLGRTTAALDPDQAPWPREPGKPRTSSTGGGRGTASPSRSPTARGASACSWPRGPTAPSPSATSSSSRCSRSRPRRRSSSPASARMPRRKRAAKSGSCTWSLDSPRRPTTTTSSRPCSSTRPPSWTRTRPPSSRSTTTCRGSRASASPMPTVCTRRPSRSRGRRGSPPSGCTAAASRGPCSTSGRPRRSRPFRRTRTPSSTSPSPCTGAAAPRRPSLRLARRRARQEPDEPRRLLRLVANAAGGALARFPPPDDTHAELRARADELEAVAGLAERLAGATDEAAVLGVLLEIGSQVGRFDGALFADRSGDGWDVVRVAGLGADAVADGLAAAADDRSPAASCGSPWPVVPRRSSSRPTIAAASSSGADTGPDGLDHVLPRLLAEAASALARVARRTAQQDGRRAARARARGGHRLASSGRPGRGSRATRWPARRLDGLEPLAAELLAGVGGAAAIVAPDGRALAHAGDGRRGWGRPGAAQPPRTLTQRRARPHATSPRRRPSAARRSRGS